MASSTRVQHEGDARMEKGNPGSLAFPPFPSVPLGVAIVPFNNFKEHGIQLTPDENGREVDGLGIPTVPLPILDEPVVADRDASSSRSKSQSSSIKQGFHGQHYKQWWQEWEEYENMRSPLFLDPRLPRLDRIYIAISQFRNSRRWPFEKFGTTGPKYFWDQFRIFVGTQSYLPAWNRTDKPKIMEDPSYSPEYSDREDDARPKKNKGANIEIAVDRNQNMKKQPIPPRPPYAYYNVKPVDIDSDEAVRKLIELDKLRKEERLINFLTDPESAIKVYLSSYMREQGFMWSDRNLDTVPRLTIIFLKYVLRNRSFPEPDLERKFQNALQVAEQGLKQLPLTSIISKFLPDQFGKACQDYWGFQRRAQQSIWSDDELDNSTDASDHDYDSCSIVCEDPLASAVQPISVDQISTAGPPSDDPENSISSTFVTVPEAFDSLLTPTSPFPTTHSISLVERSLRRIIRVLPPGTFASAFSKSQLDIPASAERDLETMLVKVVLAPWIDSGLFGFDKPEIVQRTGPGSGQYDPLQDDITVLVSVASKNLDVLRNALGMGLAGTWVQLAREHEDEWDPRRVRYWYIDHLDAVVPSYWMS